MLGFLRRNCFHLTDVNARRLLYLSLVRSHLSFGCEIWAPQGPSADLLRLEGIQFINQPLHHSTRSSSGDFLRPNLCKTSLFRDSYFNRIVFLWNNLPSGIKASSSVTILKTKLYIYYYTNKRITVFDIDRPRTWKTLCSKCR
jgi:hypothetical protein